MTKRTLLLLTAILGFSLLFQGCAPAPAATPTPLPDVTEPPSDPDPLPPDSDVCQTVTEIDPSLSVIKIPAATYLTGSAAFYGEMFAPGFELALEKVNGEGGVNGHRVELVFFDSGYERQQAVTEFIKVASDPQYLSVIGPGSTMEGVAVQGLAEEYEFPFFAFSSPSVWPTEFNDWTFRLIPTPADAIPAIIDYAVEQFGMTSVAIIYDMSDDALVTERVQWQQDLGVAGIEIVADEAMQKGDLSFAAQLTTIQAANPDVLIVATQPMDAGPIMAQARQTGFEGPFMGAGGLGSTEYYDLSGGAAEGALAYVMIDLDSDDANMVEFRNAYIAKYDDDMALFTEVAVQSYDGLIATVEIYRCAPELTRQSVRDTWAETSLPDQLLMGPVTWDGSGDPIEKGIFLAIMEGGTYTVIR